MSNELEERLDPSIGVLMKEIFPCGCWFNIVHLDGETAGFSICDKHALCLRIRGARVSELRWTLKDELEKETDSLGRFLIVNEASSTWSESMATDIADITRAHQRVYDRLVAVKKRERGSGTTS